MAASVNDVLVKSERAHTVRMQFKPNVKKRNTTNTLLSRSREGGRTHSYNRNGANPGNHVAPSPSCLVRRAASEASPEPSLYATE